MLLILGAGGFARELYFHVLDTYIASKEPMPEIVFYDDVSKINILSLGGKTFRVLSDFNDVKKAKFLAGVGDPRIKQILVKKALQAGLEPAESIVHPTALIQDKVNTKIGKGGVITPYCVLTTNIRIGNYVILNLATTIGHDSIIEDYVTINPGVPISGNVVIKEAAMIGVGAAIIEKKTIEKGVVLGAQSCVTKDLSEPNGIYYGIPAKIKLNN